MGVRHWFAAAALLLPLGAGHAADLRIGYTADALTLDPGNHRSRDTETLLRLMYDGLTTHDPAMKVVPALAESWQQVDPVTYEFKLRKGVKFHSGEEMTADDVVFTFDRLMQTGALNGQTSPRKGLLGPLKEVQKVDPYTVRFVLSAPWPVFPAMLTFQEVLNRQFAEKEGTAGLATQEDGTGPFRLLEWRRGDSMVLQRFKDYFDGSSEIPPAGKACVGHVIIKIIPENASRVAALLAGDVDLINELPVFDMKRVAAATPRRNSGCTTVRTSSPAGCASAS